MPWLQPATQYDPFPASAAAVPAVPEGTTVEQVMTRFEVPLDDTSVILLNGLTVPLDTPLSEGDTAAAFSAIAGG
jgi:sulfur carrier protein ThiS